jgi:hypothetical protein
MPTIEQHLPSIVPCRRFHTFTWWRKQKRLPKRLNNPRRCETSRICIRATQHTFVTDLYTYLWKLVEQKQFCNQNLQTDYQKHVVSIYLHLSKHQRMSLGTRATGHCCLRTSGLQRACALTSLSTKPWYLSYIRTDWTNNWTDDAFVHKTTTMWIRGGKGVTWRHLTIKQCFLKWVVGIQFCTYNETPQSHRSVS